MTSRGALPLSGDAGIADLYAVPALFRRQLAFSQLAGAYNAVNLLTGGEGTATISDTGAISASDEFGCQYNGQISLPDARFNQLEITVNVSNCAPSNGTYVGYGSTIDRYQLGDSASILLAGTNGAYASFVELYQ